MFATPLGEEGYPFEILYAHFPRKPDEAPYILPIEFILAISFTVHAEELTGPLHTIQRRSENRNGKGILPVLDDWVRRDAPRRP